MTLIIEDARKRVAAAARRDGEEVFAREVLAGAWDHRNDVEAALSMETRIKGEVFWAGPISERDDFGNRIDKEFIDGKSKMGPWGFFTPEAWAAYGVGRLGQGYGQRYEKLSNGRWLKVEG